MTDTYHVYCARHPAECVEMFGDIMTNAADIYAQRSGDPCAQEIANGIRNRFTGAADVVDLIDTAKDLFDLGKLLAKGVIPTVRTAMPSARVVDAVISRGAPFSSATFMDVVPAKKHQTNFLVPL